MIRRSGMAVLSESISGLHAGADLESRVCLSRNAASYAGCERVRPDPLCTATDVGIGVPGPFLSARGPEV